MQFEISYSVKQTTFKVISSNFKQNVVNSLGLSYERIGGNYDLKTNTWIFPPFINHQIIEEIIHNTCFVCGGLMMDGQALDNTWVYYDDFGGDAGQYGTTCSKLGQPVIKKVRKCTSCGHSHT